MDHKKKKNAQPELSEISFGELLQLGKTLGSKTIKEARYGTKNVPTSTSRKNKNRPREASSKQKPEEYKAPKSKMINVDPRFDRLFGNYHEETFKKDYDFLSDIQKREKRELKKQLLSADDSKKQEKIKKLISRMENREREHFKLNKRKEKEKEEVKSKIEALEKGQKPHFRTKYEKKLVNLVDKYDELKKSGKLGKYIKKKERKFKPY